ncbi:hypothetical protein KFE25_000041 [Diacronema lutheri]|uniref:Uncharacterized protein n=1 Tax=Diacronema lutheri TaxID=2081491 RepID=A0A8J5XGV9_DIALT|nr:hypothetical protein KFE25_000041 [Diacronema lutheri]
MKRHQVLAASLVVVGAALAGSAGRTPPPGELPSANPHRDTARERAAAIRELLAAQEDMPAAEKIGRAYDGAVNTHEIGFPRSRVR